MKIKQNSSKIILASFLIILVAAVFKVWFTSGIITSGDYPFFFKENLQERLSLPLSWNNGYNVSFLAQWPHEFLTGLLSKMGMDFIIVERLAWFWPFLVLSILSSWYFAKTLFPHNKFIYIMAPFIYLFNTYILTITVGGQVGILLSYAFAPLVITIFIKYISNQKKYYAIISGLALSIQIIFDPRISFLTAGVIALYSITVNKYNLIKYVKLILLPLIITIGLHFYWILPTLLVGKSPLPVGYGNTNWVDFLSFASLSNTISLLHPNWPESTFGKTYFMKPEFILIPILAYSSLLFINKYSNDNLQTRKNILFFSILGLVAAFLAKGVNPPFGEIYRLLFEMIPGFNMFRDPSKFYILTAISYSLLIPFSIESIYKLLQEKVKNQKPGLFFKIKNNLHNLFAGAILIYLLMLIKPAWAGELKGTFKTKIIPQEYLELKKLISNQDQFFRTLWIPGQQRYGYYDSNHPAISAYSYYDLSDPSKLFDILRNSEKEHELQNLSVKYLIIPLDIDGDFFNKDWKFDPVARELFEKEIDSITYVTNKRKIGGITLYEIENSKNHSWVKNGGNIQSIVIDPTKYSINGNNTGQTKIVFSEKYDPLWEIRVGNKIVKSEKYTYNLNSFTINTDGEWQGSVEFSAQKYVRYGLIVNVLTLISSVGLLILAFIKKI